LKPRGWFLKAAVVVANLSNFGQIQKFHSCKSPQIEPAIKTGRSKQRDVMRDSERYRKNAADCLLAARDASEPHLTRINLLMAQSWLALATHDVVMAALLTKWEAEAVVPSLPDSARDQVAA